MSDKKNIQPLYCRASFDPATFNSENNTVELVAATDSEVRKFSWSVGEFIEVLSMESSHVRMDRIKNGAPLLDNHNNYGSVKEIILGVVTEARLEKGQLRVVVQFSKREEVAGIIQDIKDGILRNVSIGYRVYKYQVTEESGKLPVYRAEDWEPFEVSLVGVPADFMAGTRSQRNSSENEVSIINSTNSNTNHMSKNANGQDGEVTPTTVTRSQETPETPNPAQPAASAVADNKDAVIAERTRGAEILKSTRAAGLSIEFAQRLIEDANVTVDSARKTILEELAKGQNSETRSVNPAANLTVSKDETDKRRLGMENAILHRANPAALGKDDKPGEYRGLTLIRLAEESLRSLGVSTRGMTNREIALAALNNTRGLHATSDFPIILGNTVNRSLRAAYALAGRTFTQWARRGSVSDFREVTRVSMGDLSTVDEVLEHGEYKRGTVGEEAEKYKVTKYGKIIGITWEALVNDDLGAFDRLPSIMGAACAQKQSDLVYAILTSNPSMADGTALFHADHGNLANTGTAISINSLGAMRAAIRKQKSKGGNFLNLTPKFLLVGPDKEQEALQFTSDQYVAAKNTDINVWRGLTTPIVEARLTGNQWYGVADPSMIDTIEYSFLDGEELFTEMRDGFDIDGMEVKVRMVFGAKALDFRGMYKNAGA